VGLTSAFLRKQESIRDTADERRDALRGLAGLADDADIEIELGQGVGPAGQLDVLDPPVVVHWPSRMTLSWRVYW